MADKTINTNKMYEEWENLPAVLTPQEIADLLRVHVNTVNTMIREGDLPSFNVRRGSRVHRADLLRYAGLLTE